jgi:Protein kinase domain
MSLKESRMSAESSRPHGAASLCPICGVDDVEARCVSCGSAARAGGYEVQRLISRTPHSRVYLARSLTEQEVALKELLFAQVPGTRELEAFEREARLLETLSHPRIPRLLGHFQEGEGAALRLYVAEQYIAGETLLARLEHHTFTDDEARGLALQVLEILEYLHGRMPPVLHRDLKPANLILRPDGELCLVDFGSAREAARGATLGSTLVGTFGYMPLEQFGGTVDVTSDLYALGATLMHLLGRTPPAEHFQPSRGLELGHLEPSALFPWLRKVTALQPEERYASVALARRALEELPRGRRTVRQKAAASEAPSGDAPSALARLEQEAAEARAASSAAQARQEAQLSLGEQAANPGAARRKVRHEDDRMSVVDFYRMVSPRLLRPYALPWMSLMATVNLYILFNLFDLESVPAPDTPIGAALAAGLLCASYALLAAPCLVRALGWRRKFQKLPFALEGLGRLVHRGDGDFRTFIPCSLRLRLKESDASAPDRTVKAARDTALRLAVDRANAVISRVAGHPEFFERLRWSVQADHATGHANERIAGQLLAVCAESLAPLQRDLGLIEAVIIEPSDGSFFLPYGD